MIASMLKYAEENDPTALENLDFRIVFMGASIEAMNKEPFSHYPEKLLHYSQLGITETIDKTWKREQKLDLANFCKLLENIGVKKKVWVGVSCSIFEQILNHYQDNSTIEVVAIRDNPSPHGDTDYFKIADEVQNTAKKIAVPSQVVFDELDTHNKEVIIVGHAPIEEWQEAVQHIDRDFIIGRLDLNSQRPIVVYTGVYGDCYKDCFDLFLDVIPREDVEVLIVPHPRTNGNVEKEACKSGFARAKIVGEFVEDPLMKIKTVEALSIADFVVTADATSTIVFQANALNKKVLYVNPSSSKTSDMLCNKKLIHRVSSKEEFSQIIQDSLTMKNETPDSTEDIFKLLGIPKQSAKLLWNEFLK